MRPVSVLGGVKPHDMCCLCIGSAEDKIVPETGFLTCSGWLQLEKEFVSFIFRCALAHNNSLLAQSVQQASVLLEGIARSRCGVLRSRIVDSFTGIEAACWHLYEWPVCGRGHLLIFENSWGPTESFVVLK